MVSSKAVSDRGFIKVSRMIFLPTSIFCSLRLGRVLAVRSHDCSGSFHLISLTLPWFYTEELVA